MDLPNSDDEIEQIENESLGVFEEEGIESSDYNMLAQYLSEIYSCDKVFTNDSARDLTKCWLSLLIKYTQANCRLYLDTKDHRAIAYINDRMWYADAWIECGTCKSKIIIIEFSSFDKGKLMELLIGQFSSMNSLYGLLIGREEVNVMHLTNEFLNEYNIDLTGPLEDCVHLFSFIANILHSCECNSK